MTMAILDAAVFSWIDLFDLITDLRTDDWDFLLILQIDQPLLVDSLPNSKRKRQSATDVLVYL